MLRGLQKKMIVVQTKDSRLFEEAYFVMRKDGSSPAHSGMDILSEADRIINGSLSAPNGTERKQEKSSRLRQLFWFCAGVLCGGGLTAFLWLILL